MAVPLKRKHEDVDNGSDSADSPDAGLPRKFSISAKPDHGGCLKLKAYFASRKGEREEMQDAHVVMPDFKRQFPNGVCNEIRRLSYFAVFDGHGGVRASKYAADNLHKILADKFPKGNDLSMVEKDLKRCFLETYKKVDDDFLVDATKTKPPWKDGSTATTLLIINDVLYVANLGDSKAIICRFKPEEKKEIGIGLTKDHNPTMFEERMRIQNAGGTVKDGRIMGVLEVSRSLGDGQYKKHGVTCIPDIKRCTLTSNDRYILAACDGLWKVFGVPEALQAVQEVLKDEKIQPTEEGQLRHDCLWEAVVNRLAGEAVRRGSGDNVTVIIIPIGEFTDLPAEILNGGPPLKTDSTTTK